VPNLNADRAPWVAGFRKCLNVRRLMYQTLIWSAVLGDEASSLSAALDAERMKRLADALINRVRRDSQLARNLLGIEVLIDQPKAVELPFGQLRDPRADHVFAALCPMIRGLRHAWVILQC